MPVIFAATINQLWYALPLVVVVSLVYAATRHEEMRSILTHALRLGLMITGFFVVMFVVLYVVSLRL